MTMNYEFWLIYIYLVSNYWTAEAGCLNTVVWLNGRAVIIKLKRNIINNSEPSTELSFKLISIETKTIMCHLAAGRGAHWDQWANWWKRGSEKPLLALKSLILPVVHWAFKAAVLQLLSIEIIINPSWGNQPTHAFLWFKSMIFI